MNVTFKKTGTESWDIVSDGVHVGQMFFHRGVSRGRVYYGAGVEFTGEDYIDWPSIGYFEDAKRQVKMALIARAEA